LSQTAAIGKFFGAYEGSGRWHDEIGKSGTYRVGHNNRPTANGFAIEFKHDFDDTSIVEARFSMAWLESGLFRVTVAGTAVGNGYVFDEYCHYHIATDRALVEVSYRLDGNRIDVFGSSTRNAEGHYIAWRETLRRR
jgi:hypothetical protein